MSNSLVFGTPYQAPVLSKPWTALLLEWEGYTGKKFNLSEEAGGTYLMPGVRGLTMPQVNHFVSESPAVDGVRWRGLNVPAREVFWPLRIWNDLGSAEWTALDRELWRTLNPARTGTFSCTHPTTNETRTLVLRFVAETATPDTDPVLAQWAHYGVRLQAEQPYWAGPAVSEYWGAGGTEPFFGTVFTISPGRSIATAKMTNPGDVPAFPTWKIVGPTTTATVGLNGQLIEIPFPLLDTEVAFIDTAPTAQTCKVYNVTAAAAGKHPRDWQIGTDLEYASDRTGDLGAVSFAAIPEGGQVTLSLTVDGAGGVQAILVPLYYRAW